MDRKMFTVLQIQQKKITVFKSITNTFKLYSRKTKEILGCKSLLALKRCNSSALFCYNKKLIDNYE